MLLTVHMGLKLKQSFSVSETQLRPWRPASHQPASIAPGLGRASNSRHQLGSLQSNSWRPSANTPWETPAVWRSLDCICVVNNIMTGTNPLSRIIQRLICCSICAYGFQTWICLGKAKADMSLTVLEAYPVRIRVWQWAVICWQHLVKYL